MISPPVNSHAIHPGQTPVADASRYYLLLIMDPSLFFHKHCNYVTDRIDKRNNMLKALAGSSWGQAKETLLLTYNALGKSIASYAAPVWSTNASDSSLKKIQTTQNVALRTAAGSRKMASIDHLHQESLTLKVNDHSDMLSVQYLVNCLEEGHVCHGSRTQEPKPKPMKETLHSRHHPTVLPRLGASRKERPPPNIRRGAETEPKTTIHSLTATIRTLPSTAGLQALSVRRTKRHMYILWSFTTRRETLVCLQRTPADLSPEDLWRNPVGSIRAFSYLDNGKFSDAKHPELHHSKIRPSSRPMRWFTHIDSHINKLLSEARIARDSSRSSF